MLDPQHLNSFREIARTGSYSEAARRLGYTQPALSYQMRILEKAVGAPLTARAGRSIRLTPAGQSLLRHADQILTAIRVAERDLAHVVGSHSGVVRIAAFSSGRATLVADALAEIGAVHPALDVRLVHADPLDATAMVVRGDADLAVTYRYGVEELTSAPPTVRSDGTSSLRRSPLSSMPLLDDRVHLVLPAQHRLADSELSNLAPLADERFLVGSDLFLGLLERAAAQSGFAPRDVGRRRLRQHAGARRSRRRRRVASRVGAGRDPARRRHHPALARLADPTRGRRVVARPPAGTVDRAGRRGTAIRRRARRRGERDGSPPLGDRHAVGERGSAGAVDVAGESAWAPWFDAVVTTLPRRAAADAERAVMISDASGLQQVHVLDGSTLSAPVTERDGGVALADISSDGREVWWFADDHGDERGVWMTQPFGGGPAVPATSLAEGTPTGLSFGGPRAAVGRTDRNGSEVYIVDLDRDRRSTLVYSSDQYASVGALAPDGELVAVSHSEHGNSLKPAIRVLAIDRDGGASVAGELSDGPGLGVWPVAFGNGNAAGQLLVHHEREGRLRPLLWYPFTGEERSIDVPLPGDISASWFPDGTALLVLHHHRARSELYRVELADGSLRRLPTPTGHIADAAARPDGDVEYLWSSATSSPLVLRIGATADSETDSPRSDDSAPPGPALTDLTVPGDGGNIHVLIARPDSPVPGSGPGPTVFLVHGGPAAHDTDSYSPVRNAWTSLGFTTVQVNYRGSSGYGSEWQAANVGRSGRAELEDLVTVRDALVADGTADPDRIVIAGRSWGGYLALLALGQQPGLWSLGVAIVPVADTSAVYEDMMDQLRASYRVRFGGEPTDVPDAYVAASPLSFVADVAAPVLLTAGLHDPRCPIRQIELYVSRLAELGKPHGYHAFDRGHDARARDERVEEMAMVFDFVGRHL